MSRINKNIAGLATGAVLGQGSYFIAAAYLVSKGMLSTQAGLAIIFSVATLALWLTDLSVSNILARKISIDPLLTKSLVASGSRLRLKCALVVSPALALFLHYSAGFPLLLSLALSFAQCIAWSFNLSGFFDAERNNSISGPISSLNWLFASTSVVYQLSLNRVDIQLSYFAFSIGTIVTVAIQYLLYRQSIANKTLPSNHSLEQIISFKEAFNLSLGSITAQAYPRVVLLATYHFLSPTVAGVLSFAKTTINGVALVISIVRRHDIIEIIRLRKDGLIRHTTQLLKTQSHSIVLGFFGYLISLTIIIYSGRDRIAGHLTFVVMLHLAAALWLLASSMLQILIAEAAYSLYSRLTIASVIVNLSTFTLLLPSCGEWAIAAGEIAMAAVQILGLKKYRRLSCGK